MKKDESRWGGCRWMEWGGGEHPVRPIRSLLSHPDFWATTAC